MRNDKLYKDTYFRLLDLTIKNLLILNLSTHNSYIVIH